MCGACVQAMNVLGTPLQCCCKSPVTGDPAGAMLHSVWADVLAALLAELNQLWYALQYSGLSEALLVWCGVQQSSLMPHMWHEFASLQLPRAA
jgi:hypothetical protein